jgi:hypothetical protein
MIKMFMNQFTKFVRFFLMTILVFQFTACHFFESIEVTQKEIAKASEWSSQDIGPSFEACENLDEDLKMNCFKETLTSYLSAYLNQNIPEAKTQIEEEITVTLKVDQEGMISLSEANFSTALLDAIPNFELILMDAVYALPKANPAIKSNVGVYVEVLFQLPIRILAYPQS